MEIKIISQNIIGKKRHNPDNTEVINVQEIEEIESFITKPITELVVDKQTYKETIKMTADPTQEKLSNLIEEIEKIDELARKKAKGKKRK